MTANPVRRVVTGLDAQGRSCILTDAPSDKMLIWRGGLPLDNGGDADPATTDFAFPTADNGFSCVVSDFQPGYGTDGIFWHAIDLIVVTAGELTLVTETGETLVRAGDVVVDRGIYHGWRNDGPVPARIFAVLLKADPVGKGATL